MARRAKGEGTLYQAKGKSWIYQYKLDGQRKTKRFQKKADAKAYLSPSCAGKNLWDRSRSWRQKWRSG